MPPPSPAETTALLDELLLHDELDNGREAIFTFPKPRNPKHFKLRYLAAGKKNNCMNSNPTGIEFRELVSSSPICKLDLLGLSRE